MQQEHIELPFALDSKYAESMPILEYGNGKRKSVSA